MCILIFRTLQLTKLLTKNSKSKADYLPMSLLCNEATGVVGNTVSSWFEKLTVYDKIALSFLSNNTVFTSFHS